MIDGFEADEADAGRWVVAAATDRWPLVAEGLLRSAIHQGRLRVNGEPVHARQPLCTGDQVTVRGLDPEDDGKPSLPEVLYEDDQVLAVNKPAGCTVVRERWDLTCPFVDGVLRWLRQTRGEAGVHPRFRARAVHRLDMDTTGVVLLAMTPEAEKALYDQFRRRAVKKEYLALVLGAPVETLCEVDVPIQECAGDPSRMVVAGRHGKPSVTRYELVERYRPCALLRCHPLTGRRHQVRLHLSHVGLPVVGDSVYGGGEGLFLSTFKRGYRPKKDRPEPPLIGRPALHAVSVRCSHPSGKELLIEAPLAKDFARTLKALAKWGK